MWSSCSRGTVTGVGSLLMPVRPIMLGMLVILLVILVGAAPAHAQQQSVTFNLGYFAVRGEDARISDDVLVENLDLFAFRLGDFNNASAGAEWLTGLGEYLEAGVGLGFYRRTVASTYDDFVDVDGSEIEQDLKTPGHPVHDDDPLPPVWPERCPPALCGGWPGDLRVALQRGR